MLNTKHKVSRIISAVLALVMVLTCSTALFSVSASAAGTTDTAQGDSSVASYEYKYDQYSLENTDAAKPVTSVKLNAAQNYTVAAGAQVSVGSFEGKDNVLIWNSDNGEVTWSFNVAQAGKYHLRFTYFSMNDKAQDVQIGIKIDGKSPFYEAEQVTLPKLFVSEGPITQDERNNDVRPKQIPYDAWNTESVNDRSGVLTEPYSFYLSAGTHTVTVVGSLTQIAIETVEFYNEEAAPSYAQYSAGATLSGTAYTKVYEAETPTYTSNSRLYPMYDRTSPDTSPADPVKQRYNTIGGSNFTSQGQYVVWTVEAPEDGYYYIGARVRQNVNTGMVSYRRLYVNGEVPFAEANTIKVSFNNKWQDYVFGGEENPWLIKLNKGENQLKLEVVSGEMNDIIYDLQNVVTIGNTLYREIIMITGVSPDTYRDYNLDDEITNFNERVTDMLNQLSDIYDRAVALGNDATGSFSALTKLELLLERFLEKPSEVPGSISTFNSYCSGVSSLMITLTSQPLELDTITVSTDVTEIKTKSAGFFSNAWFQIQAFLGSFVEDYTSIGTSAAEGVEKVDVWINLARDQANTLKTLTDNLFTQKTGIAVNVSLVQQSLVQATLSGMSPDVVLFIANTEPINLAMRDGLTDLSKFDTFQQVKSRFQEHSMDAYYYNGGYYAIPITEIFPMMFYRTDILDELELEVPQTWDDFYKVIRVLQHNNLTAGVPNAASNNIMAVDTGIYATLMYQKGEEMYADDYKTTNLDSDLGIEAFDMWTEFYKDYGLPYQYDFFNRFRSGEMPIGLAAYSTYGQLNQAAPEIAGLWEMAPIPGTLNEDGTINRSVCATGTCAIILKNCDNPDGAWKYIDWFTDTEAQTLYGQEMEAILGATGRHTPANVEALGNLPWTYAEQQLIMSQWNESFTLPQIPGSYILDRNLINAFRKVVFSANNPRETIVSYNKIIENEIDRKRREFGLD